MNTNPERLSDVVHYDPSTTAYWVDDPHDMGAKYYDDSFVLPSDAYNHAREAWPYLIDDEMNEASV